MTESKELVAQGQTASERFQVKVFQEYYNGVGEVLLTESQKRLAQSYFIAVDGVLRMAEQKRLAKSENYRDQVPVTWQNVDMNGLAINVVAASRIGWDPNENNHVELIPYKNKHTKLYDIGFIPGYRGIEIKAKKYGLDLPDNVIVELVYDTDKFKSYKKNRMNLTESYDFEIINEFDRGEIIGGFYYHEYTDHPERNKLVVMSLKEIEKCRPQYASAEFWGGEKDIWKNGKKTGDKEKVDGWFEKMCWKTVYRAAYRNITIDSQKIDDAYKTILRSEQEQRISSSDQEYKSNANKTVIDITPDKEIRPAAEESGVATQAPESPGPEPEEDQDVPPAPEGVDPTTGEMDTQHPPQGGGQAEMFPGPTF